MTGVQTCALPILADNHRRSLWHSLRGTQLICLVVGTLLSLLGMPWWIAVVYSLCIGNLTALFVHLGRWGIADWQVRRQGHAANAAQQHGWPGWGPMAAVLLLAVVVAYPLGSWVASRLTGLGARGAVADDWRQWAGLFLISLLPAAAGTFYFRSRAHLAATEAAMAEVARQAAQTELRLLQSQLEPHMLFNTLANLRVLIGLDPARAQAMLDHMVDWLRSTLVASRQPWHPLAAEFTHARDYLALMQVRMGPRLKTELLLPDELAQVRLPPLLLQPLVENAIRHGLEPAREGGLLRLQAERHQGRLRLSVADSGVGLQAQPSTRGTQFGLAQVRERLATLYGDQASLGLQARPEGGTLVLIELPLEPSPPTPAT